MFLINFINIFNVNGSANDITKVCIMEVMLLQNIPTQGMSYVIEDFNLPSVLMFNELSTGHQNYERVTKNL